MTEKKGPDHYRYFACLEPSGVKIVAERYVVIGETPKCWYIIHHTYAGYVHNQSDWGRSMVKRYRKRVLKQQDYGRRFAYADKHLAMFSLRERLRFKLARMKTEMSVATLAVAQAEALVEAKPKDLPIELECGHDEHTASLRWADY
ncbi:hypothetical protein 8P_059 [Pseudomonas phage 8P]|nr:hypothetical protein 8P_059 [Pseudomonas phage 8P]